MAHDILVIFLTGTAIEHQFNIGCDTYQYQRGKLQGATIQKIMILKDANPALSDQGLCNNEYLSVEWEDEEAIQKHKNALTCQAVIEEKALTWSLTFNYSASESAAENQPPAARTRYFKNHH